MRERGKKLVPHRWRRKLAALDFEWDPAREQWWETQFEELQKDVDVRPQELKMAKSLIDNMTGEFDPDEFHDEYREKLESLVERKVQGEEVTVAEERPTAKVVDLIDALKKSVEATERPAAKKKAAGARKKKAASA